MGYSRFAASLAVRAALGGGLAVLAIYLLVTTEFYATAAVLCAGAAIAAAELVRHVRTLDRRIGDFLDALKSGDFSPIYGRGLKDLPLSAKAIASALEQLNLARAGREARLHFFETLTDTMTTALFAGPEAGALSPVNRAARNLAPDIAGLAIGAPPRSLIRLDGGRRALAVSAHFAAGGAQHRVVALHLIEAELEAAELKGWQDMARILAHEMMNSLTPISSLADSIQPLAAAPISEDAARDLLTGIEAIGRRGRGLLSFVERYRRIVDLPAPFPSLVPASALADRIARLLKPHLAEAGVEFEIRLSPPDLSLLVDEALIEQAVINLVRNAEDAVRGQAMPRIELSFAADSISVADNGRGIDPAQAERLFVPFFTTKPGGAGIGLSVVRQIALGHGGHVEARNRPSGGAVFTLHLPAPSAGSSERILSSSAPN